MLDGDEGEFQTNIYKLGVSHTGYPLFFLLGKLWTIIVPVGTIAARANLFAAFWGALAVAAVFIFVKFLTRNRWAAVICALLLAASRVEWSQAVIPRPYTLNAFFVIVVAYLFFLWRAGEVDLTVPVLAFGLSLTNHRTMMWFAPAIAVFVLWRERAALFQPRRLLSLAVAFGLPLLLYGYIFWRGDSDVGVEFHMKDFGDMILGGNVNRWTRYGPLDWLLGRVTDLYVPLLIEQFTALGFVAGLIGIASLALGRPPRGFANALPAREALVFIVLANLANSAFCITFWTMDVEKFFLPSYITFLFCIGVGVAATWDWLAAHQKPVFLEKTGFWIILLFVAATGFLIEQNYARNDWSGRTQVAEAWQENLALPLEEHALLVGTWESLTPLEYSMYVEGRRVDLERWKVITQKYQLGLAAYGSRQEDIERAVRAGRPVYFTIYPGETETLNGLVDEFRMTRIAELWRAVNLPLADCRWQMVAERGRWLIADCQWQMADSRWQVRESATVFRNNEGRTIELLGYAVFPTTSGDEPHPYLRAGDFALVTLFWHAPQSLAARYTVSLRLTDAQNRKIVQRDSEPASGLRPTVGWVSGEIIQDDVGFFIPLDAPPGAYRLQVVVYNSATVEDLATPSGTVFTLGELVVR